MSEFKWHMMAEEMPEKGKKDYIVMGLKGGLYLAPRFEGYGESGDDVWFRDTRGNLHYPDKVLAWAEVPKLEDMDAKESENAKLREELAQWERLTAGIELPEYQITQFEPKDLERENTKLRELVRDALRPKYDNTLRMTPVEWREYDDDILRRACELGIEVQR